MDFPPPSSTLIGPVGGATPVSDGRRSDARPPLLLPSCNPLATTRPAASCVAGSRFAGPAFFCVKNLGFQSIKREPVDPRGDCDAIAAESNRRQHDALARLTGIVRHDALQVVQSIRRRPVNRSGRETGCAAGLGPAGQMSSGSCAVAVHRRSRPDRTLPREPARRSPSGRINPSRKSIFMQIDFNDSDSNSMGFDCRLIEN